MKYVFVSIILSIFITVIISQSDKNEKKIVCYYTNWSVRRPGDAKFPPSIINPHICTHLIYAFATFSSENGLAAGDVDQDINKNGFKDFNDLKASNDNLKTLLSIGGWGEGSARFSRIASSEDGRNYFTQSSIDLLRKYGFDGINVDWQYPTFREGSRPEDYENYVKFIESLRKGFENEAKKTNRTRMLVTMSVPAETEYNEQGYDLMNLEKYADFFNILAYDYHLSYEGNVSHHAPLYPLPEEIRANINTNLNGDATVEFLLGKGMKSENLNLGIPTFGRTYKLENSADHNLGAPSKGLGIRGETSKEEGYRTYYEICQSIKEENWTVVQVNQTAMGPYAYKGENWVGYDDENIVRAKGEYARKKGLGGIMFWTIDDDDFRANCGSRSFPLIKAGREGLLGHIRRLQKGIEPPNFQPTGSSSPVTPTTQPIVMMKAETPKNDS